MLHENEHRKWQHELRIQQTLSAGIYTIEATTYDAGATGQFTLAISGLTAVVTPTPIYTSATDRAALVALYDATGGTNWTNSSNWKSDSHLSQWHGVRTDASGRVTSLMLEKNGLRGSLPQELGNLTQLQDLQLGFNELTGTLPPQLSNLTNLHTITLNGNRLSGTIPRRIRQASEFTTSRHWQQRLVRSDPTRTGQLGQTR